MTLRNLNPGFMTALWLLPLLTLIQVGMAGHLAIHGVIPALVLIAVVNWGILRGMLEGLVWAFVGGICLDIFTGWPIGTSTVCLVLVASLVSLGQTTFMRTHFLVPLATVFVATLLYYLLALFILTSLHQSVDWVAGLANAVIPLAIFNALLNIPGFWLSRRLENRIYPLPRASW